MPQQFLALTESLVVTLGFLFIFYQLAPFLRHEREWVASCILGSTMGVFGLGDMLLGIELTPGVVVDVRAPFVIVSGVFGGWISAGITAGMMDLYRFFGIGGVGAVPGTLAIVAPVLLGSFFYRSPKPLRSSTWLLLGLGAAGFSLVFGGTMMPAEPTNVFLWSVVPALLVFNPPTPLILGRLIETTEKQSRLAEDLQRSEARFRTIFNESVYFLGVLSPAGEIINLNDTLLRFVGSALDGDKGRFAWDTRWWQCAPDGGIQLKEAVEQVAQGQETSFRAAILGNDGRTVPVDMSLKPVFDQRGSVTIIISEARDLTGELLAEQHRVDLAVARERNAILQEFIEDSTHHLKTPISILTTSLDLFERRVAAGQRTLTSTLQTLSPGVSPDARTEIEAVRAHLDYLQNRLGRFGEAVDDLTTHVEDLLQLARMQNENQLELNPVDMAELIAVEMHQYVDLAASKQITLRTEIQPAVIVRADLRAVRLVVQNLVENALRYTRANGEVRVSLWVENSTAVFSMTDTGIGIAEADRPNIFDRFYRASNARGNAAWDGPGAGDYPANRQGPRRRHQRDKRAGERVGVSGEFTRREQPTVAVTTGRNPSGVRCTPLVRQSHSRVCLR